MSYPFVKSFHDAGRRRGPILGFTIHMAEGGGTVGFLSRPNTHGVSVHYVIERSGRIVQMLLESHMHTSIRIRNPDGSSAIRQANDEDGFYGATAAKAVLGDWYDVRKTLGPNHATLAVELEGFASEGPNPAQVSALVRLTDDIRTRHPSIGLLGHRDHNIKACPGRKIPWADLGGHGPHDTQAPEAPVLDFTWIKDQPDSGPGTVTVNGDNHAVILADGTLFFLADGSEKHSYGLLRFKDGPWAGQDAYMVGDDCGFLLKRAATYVPDPNPEDAVAAARERDRLAHLENVEEVYAA